MEHLPAYAGLFGAAFLSATVFPFQSEVVLFGMLTAEHYQVWLLVLAASQNGRGTKAALAEFKTLTKYL